MIHNTPELETDRLLLRRFTKNDMEALFHIFKDKEINTYLPWYPLETMEEARDFYEERYAGEYRRTCGYRYAVCQKSENIPIGYVNVSTESSHDLGYGLLREYWHRGLITEACQAVLGKLKEDGYSYITATHDVQNPRSGAVMQRLGMEYKYSYEEQWKPKDILVTFRMYQLNFDGKNDRVYDKYWNESEVHFIECL